MRRNAVLIFTALCVVSIGGLAWMFLSTGPRLSPIPPATEAPESSVAQQAPALPAATPEAVPAPAPESAARIYFRRTDPNSHYGELAHVEYPANMAPQFHGAFNCESVHVTGGKGSCLTADRGVLTTYAEEIFDANTHTKTFTVPLAGIPSRTRVAPDGRLAAVTVFVTGHGYDSVDFTTQTTLTDTSAGKIVADLETFEVTKEGQPFSAKDFNFWGVTFAPDSDRFYATVSTNRKHYLIEGSIRAKKARVIHDNVECPSLSPDALHVAYKKRLPGDRVVWQLHVLDVKTGKETPLAERRSVDDQLEWLDNERVLYSLPHGEAPGAATDVWVARADGQGAPSVFLEYAYSPAVAR